MAMESEWDPSKSKKCEGKAIIREAKTDRSRGMTIQHHDHEIMKLLLLTFFAALLLPA